MQSIGLIQDLLDIHGYLHSLRDATGLSASQGSRCNSCSTTKTRVDFRQNGRDGLIRRFPIHVEGPLLLGVVTLLPAWRSSETRAILWLISLSLDHEIIDIKEATDCWPIPSRRAATYPSVHRR